MQKRLSIVLIETDQDRAQPIIQGLRELGEHDIHLITDEAALARRVTEIQPDIVLIDLANPSRDILEEMAVAAAPMDRPVAMFVDRSDEQLTRAAIEAGVSAYDVDGLRAGVAVVLGILALLALGCPWAIGAIAVVQLGFGWIAWRQIGGQSGDVLGALVVLGEIAGWLVIAG